MTGSFFWWLGSFIFFKVVFDASFSRDMSVIAAILLGVMVAISVFASGYFYATKMGSHLARVRLGQPSNYFGSALIVWLLTAFANMCVGKAIVFGFSKNLNRALGGDLVFRGGYKTDEGLLFAALIVIPVTLHFLTILFSVNAQAKVVQDLDSQPRTVKKKRRQSPRNPSVEEMITGLSACENLSTEESFRLGLAREDVRAGQQVSTEDSQFLKSLYRRYIQA